jgi:putative N6-adenine-specific DNA methylase
MPNDSNPSATTTYQYFAACAPGLEALLGAELRGFGLAATETPGGVEGRASQSQLWLVHRRSNLAESVRVRLKAFVARDFGAFDRGLARLPWHAYLVAGAPFEIKVTCHKSKLFHSGAVAERTRKTIERRLARAGAPSSQPTGDEPEATVFVRLDNDRVTPSIGASGELLHRRGYRTKVESAPLRETLASAMVVMLGELTAERVSRVWDPFCGSGVLPLEWFRIGQGVQPGAGRSFAFEQWPSHPHAEWQRWLEENPGASSSDAALRAWGSDVDKKALQTARDNTDALSELFGTAGAERSGFGSSASPEWLLGDFRAVAEQIPKHTAVLTNPPYGRRLGSARHVAKLYRDFETMLVQREDLRPVVVACGYRPFLRQSRLPWQRLVRTSHGGLDVTVLGLR